MPTSSYKLASLVRSLRRMVRKLRASGGADLSELETRQLYALYIQESLALGLSHERLGRTLCITDGEKRFRLWECATDFATSPLIGITEDKEFTRDFFSSIGVPVADGRAFGWRQERDAVQFALSLGCECVVKPAQDTSSGNGVTTNLTSRNDILRAFRNASTYASRILIEKHVPGDNYRFLVYKGRCLSVLSRELPVVFGDGTTNIRNLIDQANRSRISSPNWQIGDPYFIPIKKNEMTLRVLQRQGLKWDDVPKAGDKIVVGALSNYSQGCTYREVLEQAHPDQIQCAERAAKSLGMEIAGVDIISPDISGPDFNVCEINIGPGVHTHYFLEDESTGKNPIGAILRDFFDLHADSAQARVRPAA